MYSFPTRPGHYRRALEPPAVSLLFLSASEADVIHQPVEAAQNYLVLFFFLDILLYIED